MIFARVVGSTPTAPTNHPFSQQQLSDLSRRQKAAIRASRVAPMARMNESQRCCTKVGRWTAHQRISSFPRTLFRDREGHIYDYPNLPSARIGLGIILRSELEFGH